MVGFPPSLTRDAGGHHAWQSLSQTLPSVVLNSQHKKRPCHFRQSLFEGDIDRRCQSISGASLLWSSSLEPLPRERKSTLSASISVP